ncbi:hypothetical protein CULT_2470005 [[Clostridium] ultunense Esp]|nr:hypothetical protein CULT_2470005 [[Clostridium] ultunense Esp]
MMVNKLSMGSYKPSYGRQSSVSNNNNIYANASKGAVPGLTKNPLRNSGGYSFLDTSSKSTSTVFGIVDNNVGKISKTTGQPRGEAAFRIDSPHKGYEYNHINTNTQRYPNNKILQSLNHKPISDFTYNLAKNADKVAYGAKIGGRALGVVAVALDTMNVYNGYKADGNQFGKNTLKATAFRRWRMGGSLGGCRGRSMGRCCNWHSDCSRNWYSHRRRCRGIHWRHCRGFRRESAWKMDVRLF